MITFAADSRVSPAICARQREAIDIGHQGVGDHEHERLAARRPRRAARRALRSRFRPPSAASASVSASPADPAVRRVVVHHEHAEVVQARRGRAGDASARRPHTEMRDEMELAAVAAPRCRPRCGRPSAHELRRNRQPQSGAAVPTGRRARRPARRRRRSATACPAGCRCRYRDTVKCSAASRRSTASTATSTTTSPALGELDGVADQIDQHLPQPARIADQRVGHVGRIWHASSSPFSSARGASRRRHPRPCRAARTAPRRARACRASIFEKSRMSLSMASSASADSFDGADVLALLRRRAACRSARSVMPMTAFIGVRISWLMFARNSPLAPRPPPPAGARPRAPGPAARRFAADAFSAASASLAIGHVARRRVDRRPGPRSARLSIPATGTSRRARGTGSRS